MERFEKARAREEEEAYMRGIKASVAEINSAIAGHGGSVLRKENQPAGAAVASNSLNSISTASTQSRPASTGTESSTASSAAATSKSISVNTEGNEQSSAAATKVPSQRPSNPFASASVRRSAALEETVTVCIIFVFQRLE